MSINTRVRDTSPTVMCDSDVPDQRHPTLFNQVTRQLNWAPVKLFLFIMNRESELQRRLVNEGRYDERLKGKVEGSTYLTYTGLHDKTN